MDTPLEIQSKLKRFFISMTKNIFHIKILYTIYSSPRPQTSRHGTVNIHP